MKTDTIEPQQAGSPEAPITQPEAEQVAVFPEVLAEIAERNPDFGRVVSVLEQTTSEMARSLGLDDNLFDARQFVLDSLEYRFSRVSFGDDEEALSGSPDDFASLYLIHYSQAMADVLHAKFRGLNVDGMLSTYYTDSYPGVIQKCSAKIGVGSMLGVYQIAKEIRRERESYLPKSPLLTAEGLQAISEGRSSTDQLFSYVSVDDGDAESRLTQTEHSRSARLYGVELRGIISDDSGRDRIGDLVRGAGSKAGELLAMVGIQPSAWTQDGAWVAWDIAKSSYYTGHPEAQAASKRAGSFIDSMHYKPLSEDDRYRDDAARRLALRQVGWELTRNLSSDIANEVVAYLNGVNGSSEHTEIAGKLQAMARGDTTHLKSSELSEIGLIVAEIAKWRSKAA